MSTPVSKGLPHAGLKARELRVAREAGLLPLREAAFAQIVSAAEMKIL